MIRFIGAAIVFSCGGLWGEWLLFRRRKKIENIHAGIQLVSFLAWELEHHPGTIDSLPGQLVREDRWSEYTGKKISYLDELQVPSTLPKSGRVRLRECFKNLGRKEGEESVQELKQTLHWLEEMEKTEMDSYKRESRLYRPVGFSAGLALAILLL